MTDATLDLDAIEARAYHAAHNRHRWASEVGVDDVDVLDGLRRAKELVVDDVPALTAEVREVRSERDRAQLELAEEQRQRAAVDNQVSALLREVQRLQHAETRARRHAMERDRDVAEADARVAARAAEVAQLNAREARTQLELHDARYDIESLTSRLKATSDACNDALNKLHTQAEVARGNKRHVATLTVLVERVAALTLNDEGKPKDPALILYVGDLRRAIEAPVQVPGDTQPKFDTRHCATCSCIHEPCGYALGSPGCMAGCDRP